MSRVRLLKCVAVVAAAVFLGVVPVAAGPLQGKLVVGLKVENPAVEELAKRFEAQHPGVEIELLNLGASGSWLEKLAVMVVSNEVPDLQFGEIIRLAPYLDTVFQPLDPWMERDKSFDAKEYFPAALAAFTYRGSNWALPLPMSAAVFFVNMDAVRDAGLARPSNDWTLEDFEQYAAKVTRRTPEGALKMIGWRYEINMTRMEWLARAHGSSFLSQKGELLTESEGTLAGLDFYQGMVRRGIAARQGNFVNGDVGLFFIGTWLASSLRTVTFDWDVVPVPQGPGGRGNPLYIDGIYMSRTTKHPELAWEFLKYLASAESYRLTAPQNSAYAPNPRVFREQISKLPTSGQPPYNTAAIEKSIELAVPYSVFSKWPDFERELNKGLTAIGELRTGPRAAMAEIRPVLLELLKAWPH